MAKATLILIHGLPATGKTTLGTVIARRLGIPFFSKDTFKERLFDALAPPFRQHHRLMDALSMEMFLLVLENILRSGTDCVAETCWDRKHTEPALHALAWVADVKFIQLIFESENVTREKRFYERAISSRHPAHADKEMLGVRQPLKDRVARQPLRLPGMILKVNTTDFSLVDLDDLLDTITEYIHRY